MKIYFFLSFYVKSDKNMRYFKTFLNLAEVIIPFDNDESAKRFETRAKEFFDNMPQDAKRMFKIMLFLLEISTIPRYFKPFSSLGYEKRAKVVERWMHSYLMRKRNIMSALKGLVSLIYMSIDENLPEDLKYGDTACSVE
jgi:hypothetical protein